MSPVHRYSMTLEHLKDLTKEKLEELRREKLKHVVNIPDRSLAEGILDQSVSYKFGTDDFE